MISKEAIMTSMTAHSEPTLVLYDIEKMQRMSDEKYDKYLDECEAEMNAGRYITSEELQNKWKNKSKNSK